ncbi:hypothetical protein ACE5IS_16940 [Leptospira wolffii]|uniref:Translation elongation factor EFTu-like domain-containing protein n=1 Tax=Leptospira wolffii TaxID=409998 RepID=A0ABV5BTB4_9LEPT
MSTETENQEKFAFKIDTIYQMSLGRLAISGQIISGQIKTKENLKILANNVETYVAIETMEIFAKPNQVDIGFKDDYVSFVISGIKKENLKKGMILTK